MNIEAKNQVFTKSKRKKIIDNGSALHFVEYFTF